MCGQPRARKMSRCSTSRSNRPRCAPCSVSGAPSRWWRRSKNRADLHYLLRHWQIEIPELMADSQLNWPIGSLRGCNPWVTFKELGGVLMVVNIHPQEIFGNWKSGIALDFHTTSSTPIGYNESGYMQFDTVRPEIAELLYQLK